MPTISNLLTTLKENHSEILTEFNGVKGTLAKEVSGNAILHPVIDGLDIYSGNKSAMPILAGIANEHSNLNIVSLALTEYPYSIPRRYMLGWSESYPMKRYYVAFSNESNSIGVVIKEEDGDINSEDVDRNLFQNRTWVVIKNWNNGSPNEEYLSSSSNNTYIIIDVWDRELAPSTSQIESYFRYMASEYPNSETLNAI